MARKSKNARKIKISTQNTEHFPVSDYDSSYRNTGRITSRERNNIRARKRDPIIPPIEIDLSDNRELTDRELDEIAIDIVDREASRLHRRVPPGTRVVRDRRPCEGAKSARRAAAFRKGAAGKGKKTEPKRKYRC